MDKPEERFSVNFYSTFCHEYSWGLFYPSRMRFIILMRLFTSILTSCKWGIIPPRPPPLPACLGIVTKDEDVCIFCYWDEWEILKTNWLSSDSYHNIPVVRRDLVLAGQMYCSWRCSAQLWNLHSVNGEEWHYRQALKIVATLRLAQTRVCNIQSKVLTYHWKNQ